MAKDVLSDSSISRVVATLGEGLEEKQEMIQVLKMVADKKGYFKALDSTNKALEKEIENNKKVLADIKAQVDKSKNNVSDASAKAESEIALINDKVKAAKKECDNEVRAFRAKAKRKVSEVELETENVIKEVKKKIAEAKRDESIAITRKNNAEVDLAKFKEKILA